MRTAEQVLVRVWRKNAVMGGVGTAPAVVAAGFLAGRVFSVSCSKEDGSTWEVSKYEIRCGVRPPHNGFGG